MTLEEFVTATLVQIVEGVRQAGTLVTGKDAAIVNPRKPHLALTAPQMVEFDVALTLSGTTGADARAGLQVAWIELGGHQTSRMHNEAVSRVRFSVPLALPSVEYDQSPKLTEEQAASPAKLGWTQQRRYAVSATVYKHGYRSSIRPS